MVSVLEGQLSRTWYYNLNETSKKHTINLYHDTITGVRSAMLDFEEIPDSIGNSSLFMSSAGHRITFMVEGMVGVIEIRKNGWTEFTYTCVVDNQILKEATQVVAAKQGEEIFRTTLDETILTKDPTTDEFVTWYLVMSSRCVDKTSTFVHRRFKDFAELNSQVKQNLKGHHMRSSLPAFPEKTSKLLADHLDPFFIADRKAKLQIYLRRLIDIPHAAEMTCVKSFLGLMEQVKEVSYVFQEQKIGLGLVPSEKTALKTAVVSQIIKEGAAPGIEVGDIISRINGVSISGLGFKEIVSEISQSQRPLIIHFIQFTPTSTSTGQSNVSSTSDTSSSVPAIDSILFGSAKKDTSGDSEDEGELSGLKDVSLDDSESTKKGANTATTTATTAAGASTERGSLYESFPRSEGPNTPEHKPTHIAATTAPIDSTTGASGSFKHSVSTLTTSRATQKESKILNAEFKASAYKFDESSASNLVVPMSSGIATDTSTVDVGIAPKTAALAPAAADKLNSLLQSGDLTDSKNKSSMFSSRASDTRFDDLFGDSTPLTASPSRAKPTPVATATTTAAAFPADVAVAVVKPVTTTEPVVEPKPGPVIDPVSVTEVAPATIATTTGEPTIFAEEPVTAAPTVVETAPVHIEEPQDLPASVPVVEENTENLTEIILETVIEVPAEATTPAPTSSILTEDEVSSEPSSEHSGAVFVRSELVTEVSTMQVAQAQEEVETVTTSTSEVAAVSVSEGAAVNKAELVSNQEHAEADVAPVVPSAEESNVELSAPVDIQVTEHPEPTTAATATDTAIDTTSVATEPVVSIEQSIVETKAEEMHDVIVTDEAESVEL